jgi:pyruvate dehydrogenase E1 component
LPKGAEQDILKGMYHLSSTGNPKSKLKVQLLGSGTILREVIQASEMLSEEWGVEADIWGCLSFTELGRDIQRVNRLNMLNPTQPITLSHVEICLKDKVGPGHCSNRLYSSIC